jgi:hypothetical protein
MFFNFLNLLNIKNFIKTDSYLFYDSLNVHVNIINKLNLTLLNSNKETNFMNTDNMIMQNYIFKNDQFRRVRLTYFNTDEQQMLNSVWYPSYDYNCPILTIDLAKFKENVSLCFINLVEMYDNIDYYEYNIKPFVKIKEEYKDLDEQKSKHLDNFNNIISDSMIYSHIYNDTKHKNEIPEILNKYIETYNNLFIKKPVNRYYIEEKHIEYNKIRLNIEKNFFTKAYFNSNLYNKILNEFYNKHYTDQKEK